MEGVRWWWGPVESLTTQETVLDRSTATWISVNIWSWNTDIYWFKVYSSVSILVRLEWIVSWEFPTDWEPRRHEHQSILSVCLRLVARVGEGRDPRKRYTGSCQKKMKPPNNFLGFPESALKKQKGEGQQWNSHHARCLSLVLSPKPLSKPRPANWKVLRNKISLNLRTWALDLSGASVSPSGLWIFSLYVLTVTVPVPSLTVPVPSLHKSGLGPVATVAIAPMGAESPDSGRMGVTYVLVSFFPSRTNFTLPSPGRPCSALRHWDVVEYSEVADFHTCQDLLTKRQLTWTIYATPLMTLSTDLGLSLTTDMGLSVFLVRACRLVAGTSS